MRIRQALFIHVREARVYYAQMSAVNRTPSAFALQLGNKLRRLREDIRHMSPEDVQAKSGGAISSSYVRRVEKGIHVPTVETLSSLLEALDSNLGLFFEDMLETVNSIDVQDRRYQRILQRSLKKHRADTIAVMHILERQGLES